MKSLRLQAAKSKFFNICTIIAKIRRFFTKKRNLAIAGLLLLCLIAFADYIMSGLTRRTLVFHSADNGQELVEERMIARTGSRETDIIRYVEEVILGTLSLETEPLLNRDAKLEALLLRDDTVYLNMSEEAAIPPAVGRVTDKLETLREGIRRNFPFVTNVRVFIEGNEIAIE
ncbi:MAG: hypothetical protein LBB22_02560 [Treponema sp.]|jgi:hypothetical protein|nr:hypothetical protein [Treponema sp.]